MSEPAHEPANADNSGWITGNGSFGEIETVPEGVRGVVSKKGWKNVESVVKSYTELENLLGKVTGQLNIPDKIDDGMAAAMYAKLGKPESPDKYSVEYKGDLPLDENLLGSFKKFAHGLNLTGKQFNDVVNFQLGAVAEALKVEEQERTKATEETVKALKEEWKENYDGNFKAAKTSAEKLGILDELESIGIADNPKVIKMLHKLNGKLSEDTLSPKPAAGAISKEDELKQIMLSDALKNRMHPDHKKVHARFLELHGIGGQA